MSKYTTELRYICEQYAGQTSSSPGNQIEAVITAAWPKIFTSYPQYPIFDESYREELNKKILRHYYTREIGYETVGLWKFKLNTKMCEIMPYYNQLYKSAQLEFDPFNDTDFTRKKDFSNHGSYEKEDSRHNSSTIIGSTTDEKSGSVNKTTSGSNTTDGSVTTADSYRDADDHDSTTSITADDWVNTSDTPQNGLTSVKNGTYLTSAQNTTRDDEDILTEHRNTSGSRNTNVTNEQETTTSGKDDTTTTDKSEGSSESNTTSWNTGDESGSDNRLGNENEIIKGKTGGKSYSLLLQEYRETLLNIDMMVIDELSGLFMQLW